MKSVRTPKIILHEGETLHEEGAFVHVRGVWPSGQAYTHVYFGGELIGTVLVDSNLRYKALGSRRDHFLIDLAVRDLLAARTRQLRKAFNRVEQAVEALRKQSPAIQAGL